MLSGPTGSSWPSQGRVFRLKWCRIFQMGHFALWGGNYDSYRREYAYDGDVFLLLDSEKLGDGDIHLRDLYWAGTYTYKTVKGINKTISSFCSSRELARTSVRFKFGLYDFLGLPMEGEPMVSTGSGFTITKDGYILTNFHVVENAKRVMVNTPKGTLKAAVMASDKDNDIALLKISGEFTPATFAADKTAKLGQTVFTIGFPMPSIQGLSPKVTKGVISGLNGWQDDTRRYQIDASVQPGNSGGPLADEYGNVVGIVVSRITGGETQNVNYAIKKTSILDFINKNIQVSKQIQTDDPKKTADDSGEKNKPKFEDSVDKLRKATVLVMSF